MKKAMAIVISILFVFAMSAASFAAEKAAEKKEAAPMEKTEKAEKKAAHKQVTGEVAAVDAAAKTITVKGKKGDVTVSVDEKTKIMEGKAKKALSDVQAGSKVTVKYTEADGKNTAKSVTMKAAAKKAEKKEAAPMEKKEAAPAAEKKAAPAKKAAGY